MVGLGRVVEEDGLEVLAGLSAGLAEVAKCGLACPSCGWRRTRESDPFFGGFERDGLMFQVCPRCGADWPEL